MSENKILTPKIKTLLNEGKNESIPILQFEDGILNIQASASYRVSTLFNGLQPYSFSDTGAAYWKPQYDMPEQDFSHFSNEHQYTDIMRTRKFLSAFKADSFDEFNRLVCCYNPMTTPARELLRLGAPQGEFIKISKYEEEFMIDYDNMIFTKEDIDNLRNAYNNSDCRRYGHPPGTIYQIEGTDYTVDENGRVKIPEGVTCTPARVKFILPEGSNSK